MFGYFSQNLSLDLGTVNTYVHIKGKGIVLREPSVVAVHKHPHGREIIAVGSEAREMMGRTPAHIEAFHPLRSGVIADFDAVLEMLSFFLSVAFKKKMAVPRPVVAVCVPAGVTSVEMKALSQAVSQAGARQVYVLEQAQAAALGAGLPIYQERGSMVIDIGGGTSEIAVFADGGVVTYKSATWGGDNVDQAISDYIRQRHNTMIGVRAAEAVKMIIASADPADKALSTEVSGRDMVSGLPRRVSITAGEVTEVIHDQLDRLVDAVGIALEKTPPELAADIRARGIMLTGGGALLEGCDRLLAAATGMPVIIADNPMDCVVLGGAALLEEPKLLRKADRSRR